MSPYAVALQSASQYETSSLCHVLVNTESTRFSDATNKACYLYLTYFVWFVME